MKLRSLLLSFAILAVGAPAVAGEVRAKVISVRVDKNGMGMAVFDTQINSSLACVIPAYNNALAFDVNTPGGRGLLAIMLSAKATNSLVHAYSTGSCSVYGSYVEDVNYANVE